LEIHPEGSEIVYVRGKGAGRWPTTEAVIADVFDLYRASANFQELRDLNQPLNTLEHGEQNAHAPLGD